MEETITNSTEHSDHSEEHEEKLDNSEAWLYGILFSIGIGLIGLVVSAIVAPFFKKYQKIN